MGAIPKKRIMAYHSRSVIARRSFDQQWNSQGFLLPHRPHAIVFCDMYLQRLILGRAA